MKYFGEEIKSGKKLDKRLQGECSQSKEKSPFELLAGVIACGQAVLCRRPAVRNSNSDAVKKAVALLSREKIGGISFSSFSGRQAGSQWSSVATHRFTVSP